VVHEEEASSDHAASDLAAAYSEIMGSATERVAHILKVQSLNPQAMLDHLALFRTLMFRPSPLERYQREMIGTLVSVLNDCHY
jgi:hypothetical protein